MRSVVLYIATSLDGYIADREGTVDWLEDIPKPEQTDYGYADFYDSIDAVLLGRKTYDQVLSFDVDYPYADKKSYVFTHQSAQAHDQDIEFIENAVPFVRALKQKEGKDIWLVGGASLFHSLFKAGLVDELRIFIMPIILGMGVPLFQSTENRQSLDLQDARDYSSGVVAVKYYLIS